MTPYHKNGDQPWQNQHQNEAEKDPALPSMNPIASPVLSKSSSVIDENLVVLDYKPPGNNPPPFLENQRNNNNNSSSSSSSSGSNNNNNSNNPQTNKKVQWVYNPVDGSVLMDHNGIPLSVDRLLATKPLKHELSTRPGPGNKKLTYISGDDVSRTLNDIFGFDGWDLDIKDVSRVDASKDPKTGKHTIVYTARVRVTHKASGTYKEDCGAGDSTDRVYGTAIAHALKASITDAMKRAARHFGDKLGNSLYSGNFNINKAPVSLKDALDKYDIHRCNTKFGFQNKTISGSSKMINTTASSTSATFNHPSMPPPTASNISSHPKLQQTEPDNQKGIPLLHNNPVTSEKYTSVQQQHQKPRQSNPQQQQQQQQQQQRRDRQQPNTNRSTCSSAINSEASNIQRQNKSHDAYITKSHAPNTSGSTNIHQQNYKQSKTTARTNFAGMPQSDVSRPTSSYGQRSSLGSSHNMSTNQSVGATAYNVSSGSSSTMNSGGRGQVPNSNDNNQNNSRRVSIEQNNFQQEHQRQQASKHTHHSVVTSASTNAHTVSQTPSIMHGGVANSGNNTYSNPHNKRPPLGSLAYNPTASGFSSDLSTKRQKQQRHHNPYNHSASGRKSI